MHAEYEIDNIFNMFKNKLKYNTLVSVDWLVYTQLSCRHSSLEGLALPSEGVRWCCVAMSS